MLKVSQIERTSAHHLRRHVNLPSEQQLPSLRLRQVHARTLGGLSRTPRRRSHLRARSVQADSDGPSLFFKRHALKAQAESVSNLPHHLHGIKSLLASLHRQRPHRSPTESDQRRPSRSFQHGTCQVAALTKVDTHRQGNRQ